MPTITIDCYMSATDNHMGWCPECEDFTRDSTEPDAQGYDCPVCDGHAVMGAEDAMIQEEFDIE